MRFTHRDTFYPLQYDNLNLVETFGRNHRITFPFRTIEKLRNVPPAERAIDGRVLTYVYHLFPNVSVVDASRARPRARVRTAGGRPDPRLRLHAVGAVAALRGQGQAEALARAREFAEAGGGEDTAVSLAIQRGLASGANESFVFGRYEGAVASFHRNLHELIDGGR